MHAFQTENPVKSWLYWHLSTCLDAAAVAAAYEFATGVAVVDREQRDRSTELVMSAYHTPERERAGESEPELREECVNRGRIQLLL